MKFHVLVFGCQMNYADSARIQAVLTNCGFSYTENSKDADIIIFDTCSIKQKSEDKITGKLKTIRPDQKVRITGCMIQHNLRNSKIKSESSKFKIGNFMGIVKTKTPKIIGFTADEVNLMKTAEKSSEIIGVNNIFNPVFHSLTQKRKNIELMRRIDDTGFLPLMLNRLGYDISYDQELINEYEKILPEHINTSMNTHQITAYVPISTGCNQFCAYCIVPYARGLEKYFPVEQIVNEAKTHLKNGAQEIVLLGQIVNKHPEFVTIIQEILKLKGLKRLRYTSPYPTYYSKELLALHEQEEKLCPHIHMPLQSGSNSILKKMFRGYTVQQAKECIDTIRKLKRPGSCKGNISITTDIIVGFCDETEEDFQQTLDLVKYGNFDMVYIGIYSSRPGTLAAKNYSDNISRTVKRDRRNRLNDLLKDISRKNNEKEVGKIKEILVNKISKGITEGYTDNMKQVLIEGKNSAKVGEFLTVKIIKAIPFKLYGEIIS
ncbi:MAG: MiaB/RimO family radical SAM methylthiotransferase [candidate division SR1 bacterium]|nr:MiaB/RimO family radical SAM methylthiotransferase [candidate division SR1 bacterium]